eukprot:scaffold143901_cov17-Tisochrysis_lutea.AAC.3
MGQANNDKALSKANTLTVSCNKANSLRNKEIHITHVPQNVIVGLPWLKPAANAGIRAGGV